MKGEDTYMRKSDHTVVFDSSIPHPPDPFSPYSYLRIRKTLTDLRSDKQDHEVEVEFVDVACKVPRWYLSTIRDCRSAPILYPSITKNAHFDHLSPASPIRLLTSPSLLRQNRSSAIPDAKSRR